MAKWIFRQPIGRTKEQIRESLGCGTCSGELILGEEIESRASGMRTRRERSGKR